MNRKQLEQCAWEKTPRDERRAKSERYDWKTKKTITKALKGNEREVRVFDPSGHTEGTMSPWVPLWSLYSDELEQRCKEGREPKLRAPYHRTRRDYTGDVESSGASHSTIKKSPAQLDREIAETLAKAPRQRAGGKAISQGRRAHSAMADDEKIRAAIAKFPSTFGMRGFPGDVFRLSPTSSYVSGGRVLLYTQRKDGNQWLDFAKGTESELRSEVIS